MKTAVKLAVSLLLLVAAASAQTFTYSTLASFPSKSSGNTVNPWAVTIDSAGNIYGVSEHGGTSKQGTAFKVTPTGTVSVLHSFGSFAGDGKTSFGALVFDSAGNLYGETALGGAFDNGTVFKLTPAGKETILHSFAVADGQVAGTVARDAAGNLYGYVGSSVFKLASNSAYSILHTFADGDSPADALIVKAGNLYGTTSFGGDFSSGAIFKLSSSGQYTLLYSFTGGPDGNAPSARLTQDAAGNLYGTTYFGGAFGNGTAFKLDTSNIESVLYSFCSVTNCPDGMHPYGPLSRDTQGNLFGIALGGNPSEFGVIYEVMPTGTETVLHDATFALALGYTLAIDKAGNLYGASYTSGVNHTGSVYKLTKAVN